LVVVLPTARVDTTSARILSAAQRHGAALAGDDRRRTKRADRPNVFNPDKKVFSHASELENLVTTRQS
jgi:hypothetical protein